MATKKKTKAQLTKIMNAGYAARNELDEIKQAAAAKANSALIGKCHRYRNSYSCPETDVDYWWIYRRVIAVDGSWLKTFSFQTDRNGKVTVQTEKQDFSDLSGWKEISDAEFSHAFNDMMRKVSDAYKARTE